MDFNKSKKAVEQVPDIDFNLEIVHPVFGHNICQEFTDEPSKRRKVKAEIINVVDIEKNERDVVQAVKKLFARNE